MNVVRSKDASTRAFAFTDHCDATSEAVHWIPGIVHGELVRRAGSRDSFRQPWPKVTTSGAKSY